MSFISVAAVKSVTCNSLWLLYSGVWLGGLWCRGFLALKQMKSMAQEDWSARVLFPMKKVTLSQEQIKNQKKLHFQQRKKNFQKLTGNLISFPVTKPTKAWVQSQVNAYIHLLHLLFVRPCPTSSLPMCSALHSYIVPVTSNGLLTCIQLTGVFWREVKRFSCA